VRALESDVDAQLFVRDGRRITLTTAGRTLLAEGRSLLAAARSVAEHVRQTEMAGWPRYVVGHTPAISGTEAYELIEPAVTAFPDTSFTLRQLYPDALSAEVLDGSVQLGLRRGVVPTPELATAVIGYHRVRLALTAEHPLAGRESVDITELAGERIALWAPPGASYYSDFLVGAFRRAGLEPDYVVSRVQGAATVAAPLTTGCAAFVTTATGPAMAGRVQVVDLTPALLVPVQALWQRHTVSEIRDRIVERSPRD
jgi:DNA-binding transcriptional LysR family regulator